MSVNFDNKTARRAGPSQFAFDQMLAQNMCRVTNDLRKHPDFEKFKYGLTSLIKCGTSGSFNNMEEIIPETYLASIINHHATNDGASMTEISLDEKSELEDKSGDDIFDLLKKDTERSHDRANDFKFDRHGRFLNSYLTEIENMSEEEAVEDAQYYSSEVVTPSQSSYHAISDPGGVSGVAEDSTKLLASIRFLLEPMGVKVEHWSLVNGKDTAYNSYSFSDQFALFKTQPIFNEIRDEVKRELEESGQGTSYNDVCQEIAKRSKEALDVKPIITPNDTIMGYLENKCNERNFSPTQNIDDNEIVQFASQISEQGLRNDARKMLQKCSTCHTNTGGFPTEFKGLTEFIENDDDSQFIEFLNSESYNNKYIDVFMDKLGVHGATTLGSRMPPTDWDDNAEFAQTYNLDPINVQNERRKLLGIYLGALSSKEEDKNEMDIICNSIFKINVGPIGEDGNTNGKNIPANATKN
jgi:hypothetical protein